MTVLYQQDSVTLWTLALLTCEKIQLISELTTRPASRAQGARQGWSRPPVPGSGATLPSHTVPVQRPTRVF